MAISAATRWPPHMPNIAPKTWAPSNCSGEHPILASPFGTHYFKTSTSNTLESFEDRGHVRHSYDWNISTASCGADVLYSAPRKPQTTMLSSTSPLISHMALIFYSVFVSSSIIGSDTSGSATYDSFFEFLLVVCFSFFIFSSYYLLKLLPL